MIQYFYCFCSIYRVTNLYIEQKQINKQGEQDMKSQQSTTEQVAVVIKWAIIIFVCSAVFKMLFPPTDPSTTRMQQLAEQSKQNLERMDAAIAESQSQPQPQNIASASPSDLTSVAIERDRMIDENKQLKTSLQHVCGQLNASVFENPAIKSTCQSVGVEPSIGFPPGVISTNDEFGEGTN